MNFSFRIFFEEMLTHIKGFYLVSAWGNPGGGYSGVLKAGELTFGKMMEDWGAS